MELSSKVKKSIANANQTEKRRSLSDFVNVRMLVEEEQQQLPSAETQPAKTSKRKSLFSLFRRKKEKEESSDAQTTTLAKKRSSLSISNLLGEQHENRKSMNKMLSTNSDWNALMKYRQSQQMPPPEELNKVYLLLLDEMNVAPDQRASLLAKTQDEKWRLLLSHDKIKEQELTETPQYFIDAIYGVKQDDPTTAKRKSSRVSATLSQLMDAESGNKRSSATSPRATNHRGSSSNSTAPSGNNPTDLTDLLSSLPSLSLVTSLCKAISSRPVSWVRQFLEKGGLVCLYSLIDQTFLMQDQSELSHISYQVEVLLCIKALLRTEPGMKEIIKNAYSSEILASLFYEHYSILLSPEYQSVAITPVNSPREPSVDSGSTESGVSRKRKHWLLSSRVVFLIFALLSSMCLYAGEGLDAAEAVMTHIRTHEKAQFRFTFMGPLLTIPRISTEIKVGVLSLINAFASLRDDLLKEMHVAEVFTAVQELYTQINEVNGQKEGHKKRDSVRSSEFEVVETQLMLLLEEIPHLFTLPKPTQADRDAVLAHLNSVKKNSASSSDSTTTEAKFQPIVSEDDDLRVQDAINLIQMININLSNTQTGASSSSAAGKGRAETENDFNHIVDLLQYVLMLSTMSSDGIVSMESFTQYAKDFVENAPKKKLERNVRKLSKLVLRNKSATTVVADEDTEIEIDLNMPREQRIAKVARLKKKIETLHQRVSVLDALTHAEQESEQHSVVDALKCTGSFKSTTTTMTTSSTFCLPHATTVVTKTAITTESPELGDVSTTEIVSTVTLKDTQHNGDFDSITTATVSVDAHEEMNN